jgi:hypothetical protein
MAPQADLRTEVSVALLSSSAPALLISALGLLDAAGPRFASEASHAHFLVPRRPRAFVHRSADAAAKDAQFAFFFAVFFAVFFAAFRLNPPRRLRLPLP